MLALQCLGLLFTPLKTKKLQENIPYILKIIPVSLNVTPLLLWFMCMSKFPHQKHSCILQCGTPVAEATEKDNNQPHIVMFRDDDVDEESIRNQYFVSVEQEIMMETSTLIFFHILCYCCHYIFNLTYHRKSGDVWVFIQEKVPGLASKTGTKRNPSAMSHFSGIQRVYDSLEKTNTQEE